MNNTDEHSVLLLYFKAALYCNNAEFVKDCSIENRNDKFDTFIDYFSEKLNKKIK